MPCVSSSSQSKAVCWAEWRCTLMTAQDSLCRGRWVKLSHSVSEPPDTRHLTVTAQHHSVTVESHQHSHTVTMSQHHTVTVTLTISWCYSVVFTLTVSVSQSQQHPANSAQLIHYKLENAASKMDCQYSSRLGRPKTFDILNHSTQQHDTSNSRQLFVLTEFMLANINNYCLGSRWRDWLHCLTRLTHCHQHSHVSSTHACAHTLWCTVKRHTP